MRVLAIDTAREWRGGQVQLWHLLGNRDVDWHLAVPADAPLAERARALGVHVHPIPFAGGWRGAVELRSLLADLRPDVVAAHTRHGHGLAWWSGARPVVVHRRVDFAPSANPLTRTQYRAAAGYVAVSEAVARILVGYGVPQDRVSVVYDGVDPVPVAPDARARVRAALGIAEDVPLIGAVGALVEHKGHRHLVDALSWLARSNPDVRAVVAGDGPLRRELEAATAALGLQDRLRWLGHREDVPELLAALDVFVHPSLQEGLGQVVIEAALSGIPLVASSAGGLGEIIQDEVTGLLVPPGDGAALARTIVAALRGRQRSAERAGKARIRALERFGVKGMVEGTLAVYDRCTSP